MKKKLLQITSVMGIAAFAATQALAAVGRTPGSFNVSATGAATYTIPIFTPPGPRGMQPGIALVYNSSGNVGPVGRGWSIAGISAISRCNRTVAQDGTAGPVTLTMTDVYCMNGNRLRLKDGVYGQAGSTYQTEIADFSLVTAVGAAGHGPASFTVQGKDGLTYSYGNTSDSRVLASGTLTAHTWLVNEIRGRSGNKVIFTYKAPDGTTTGTTHPIKVQWTATTHGASTYVYSMDFAYGATGSDANAPSTSIYGFLAGSEIRNTDLLKSISVSVSGAVKRKYVLAYNTSPTTGGKRLQSVTECSDAEASDCLSPTTVTYQDGVIGADPSTVALSASGPISWINARHDFNGDGFKDIAYRRSGLWYVRFATPSAYSAEVSTGISSTVLVAGDLLGNGRSLILALSGSTWHTYAWSGSAFIGTSLGLSTSDFPDGARLADVDGDGLADLAYVTAINPGTYTYTMASRRNTTTGSSISFASPVASTVTPPISQIPLPAGPYFVGPMISAGVASADATLGSNVSKRFDLDGDAREDLLGVAEFQICAVNPATGQIACGQNGSSTHFLKSQGGFQYAAAPLESGVGYTTDFNGDGCSDTAIGTSVLISGCNGATVSTIALSAPVMGTADWDGDGRKDVLVLPTGASTLRVVLSAGNTAAAGAPQDTGVPATTSCRVVVTDANGDGLDDLGCWTFQGGLQIYYHNGGTVTPDLAKTFKDGFDVSFTADYEDIAQGSHFPDATADYPHQIVRSDHRIVKKVVSSDGVGGTFNTTYTYYGATRHVWGRGFLGFERIKTEDSRTGAPYKIDYYRRDFPYTGQLTKREVFQPGGTLMSRQNTVFPPFGVLLHDVTNNQRYHVYSSGGDSSVYEVGGSANGQLILQTSESRTYDNWGNITAASSVITDKQAGSLFYDKSWTQSVTLSISPDIGSNWCLGLPTSSSVTHVTTMPNEPAVTLSKIFTPNYITCRMDAEVTEPSSGNRRVETNYGYDSFGNVISVSVRGRNSNGSDMDWRTSYIGWGATGQFPVSETNPLSQTTTRTFHATFGQLATETDPNNIVVVNNDYDNFGRLTLGTRADGTSIAYTYAACATHGCQNGDPASGATGIDRTIVIASERDTSGAQIRDTWTHFDAFDRPIVRNTRMLSGGYQRTGREYDVFGRVWRETVPCNQSSCTAYWITNAYDALGRLTSQSRPEGQSLPTPVTTSFGYAGRTRTVTDPQGRVTTKILDAKGLMRRSQDHAGYHQNFSYDAAGSLRLVTDSLSNQLFTATYTYGIQAFQDYTNDMDLGARTFSYNSLGELTGWTDAKLQSFGQSFDPLSRVTARTENGETTMFTFGTSAGSHNIGRLQSVAMTGYSESFTYDNKGRLVTDTVETDQTYAIDYTYSSQGSIDTVTWPTSTSSTRVKVKYGYQHGHLQSVTDFTSGAAGMVFWQANAQNARGQVTEETLGNGVVTNRAFDAVTGQVSAIQSGVGGGAALQNESYLYDLVGNVTQRQNGNAGLTENFYYDDLYRLDYSRLNSGQGAAINLDLSYDAMGNITSRSDIANGASWSYHPTKKHAVTQAGSGSYTYTYDANGNAITRFGQNIGWTSYNYPSTINGAGKTLHFSYGPNRQRYKQVYNSGAGFEATHYVGGILEKVVTGAGTDWRHYVRVGSQTVAIVSRKSTGVNAVHYMLEDHQGSPARILASNGSSVVAESFSAFGARRDPTTWSDSCMCEDLTKIKDVSRRGYTGHEAIGGVSMGLNHMNGRVQDAITGRFLSADPYIPYPGLTQSFNRYSYVRNNPLSFVDPSGFQETSRTLSPIYVLGTVVDYKPGAGGGAGGGYGGGSYTGADWNTAFMNWWASNFPIPVPTEKDSEDYQSWFSRLLSRNSLPDVENDCGPMGGMNYPNMDRTYKVGFNDGCTNHDTCYGTEGMSQPRCDRALRQDIYQAFEDQCRSGIRGYVCRQTGEFYADVYYRAVVMFGGPEFLRAQRSQGFLPPPRSTWELLYDMWTDVP